MAYLTVRYDPVIHCSRIRHTGQSTQYQPYDVSCPHALHGFP